jgi:3-oxoacyl-[acyl-carrier-protein] synthase-1
MYAGETSFYMLSYKDEGLMEKVQKASFLDGITDSMITGWLDYENDDNFEANIYTVELR